MYIIGITDFLQIYITSNMHIILAKLANMQIYKSNCRYTMHNIHYKHMANIPGIISQKYNMYNKPILHLSPEYTLHYTFSPSNATLNFTASEVDVLSLGVSGPSLELAFIVHTASSMLSQEVLATILQRATNAIYQATGKIITGITPTPPSASLLPVSTPFPPTQDSGGGILSFLPNALTSLPLPMLIGVVAAGVTLLFIIIIFLISTTVIM